MIEPGISPQRKQSTQLLLNDVYWVTPTHFILHLCKTTTIQHQWSDIDFDQLCISVRWSVSWVTELWLGYSFWQNKHNHTMRTLFFQKFNLLCSIFTDCFLHRLLHRWFKAVAFNFGAAFICAAVGCSLAMHLHQLANCRKNKAWLNQSHYTPPMQSSFGFNLAPVSGSIYWIQIQILHVNHQKAL